MGGGPAATTTAVAAEQQREEREQREALLTVEDGGVEMTHLGTAPLPDVGPPVGAASAEDSAPRRSSAGAVASVAAGSCARSIDLARLVNALPPIPAAPGSGAVSTSRQQEWGLGGDHQLALTTAAPASTGATGAAVWSAAAVTGARGGAGRTGGTRVIALTCTGPVPAQTEVAFAVQHSHARLSSL